MKIKELLSDKSKWTKYALARDINNHSVDIRNDGAVCFCLIGAMRKCYYGDNRTYLKYINIRGKVYQAISDRFGTISDFNDSSTYEQVMEVVNELDI